MREELDERGNELLGEMVRDLFETAHVVPPDQLPALSERIAGRLEAEALTIWLADYQQRMLMPFLAPGSAPLPIDGGIGGRAFIRSETVEVAGPDGLTTLWIPLLDGVDRIGVLEAAVRAADAHKRVVLQTFARALTAEIISRGQYTDTYKQIRRRADMTLSAELQWELLPPTTFSCPDVTIAGMLEPAYDVGGDAFDYAYSAGVLRVMVIDAVGHDLESSFFASLTIGAYRHARRSGASLEAIVEEIDRLLHERFEAATFVTAQLGEFDVQTGELRWVNAAHPEPLLVRNGRVIGPLEGTRRVPLGVGHMVSGRGIPVSRHQLQPGDALLFYSDGVVEARSAQGEDFGVDRLIAFLERSAASQLAAVEIVRRLAHEVLDHHGGNLRDDAMTVLVHWHPPTKE
jgi:serine phosphatase RsbU (regulator of sigma subunit)